jgi:hypothetical protein
MPGGKGEKKRFLPVVLAKQPQLSPNLEVSNLGVKDDRSNRARREEAKKRARWRNIKKCERSNERKRKLVGRAKCRPVRQGI